MTEQTLSDVLANSEMLYKKVQELTAENKRLREALAEIISYDTCEYTLKIARKALEKK